MAESSRSLFSTRPAERPTVDIEGGIVYEGIVIFKTDLDHALGQMIKSIQFLFYDIEAYGDSDTLDSKIIKEIMDQHNMRGAMSIKEFASLFSWFRPNWKVGAVNNQVKFTETGIRPTPEYEIFAETRRVPKTQYEGTSSPGLIVRLGQDALIYVRPTAIVEDYLWLKKELREYTELFNDNLDENLKDHVKAVFLGDCVLWYDDELKTFLRSQVLTVLDGGLLELECLDEGRRVQALATDLFPLPKRLRRSPAFCIPLESCGTNGNKLGPLDLKNLKTVANNLMLKEISCVFSFKWRTDNGKFPDLYRGFWKPAALR